MALADDFDTPRALEHLRRLVTRTNTMMRHDERGGEEPPAPQTVQVTADYVRLTLGQLGLGFPAESSAGAAQEAGASVEGCVEAALGYRSRVRRACLEHIDTELSKASPRHFHTSGLEPRTTRNPDFL